MVKSANICYNGKSTQITRREGELKSMGKVTVQTIAKEANVSVGTVDRALNNRGRINPETCRRILEIADRLGYHPNKIASALGRQRKLRIAAITPCNPFFFYRHLRDGFEDAVREILDYGVTVDQILCDSLGFEDQKKVLLSLDRSLYDGIALNAGSDGLEPYINDIVDSGIPVVTFNSDAKNSKRSFFVGENAIKSGRLAGDMMGRLLGGRGKVAVLTSFFHPGAAADRRGGFLEALSNYPGIKVVSDEEYSDNEEIAYSAVCKVMQEHPDLDGLFSNSATGSFASGKYVEEHLDLKKKPVLIGYDVTESVERYLKNGIFDMAIDQEPRRQSYNAIMLLYKHLTEKWLPDKQELEIRVNMVMRYNAEEHSMAHVIKDTTIH